MLIKKIKRIINNPMEIVLFIESKGLLNWLPDQPYVKLMYNARLGKTLNLDNPKTFSEKLQWLKLYDRKLDYTTYVDKYHVRQYIEKKIGEQYLIPLLGVYESFDEIDFDKMPNQFVLKCTHDSGGLVICKDKSKFDIKAARKKINKSLKRNYYYHGREWPYKNVKPRIICEELIETKDGRLPTDYKFHCFNGEPDNVMVCIERDSEKPKFFFFDKKWNLLRYNVAGINAPENFTLPKPKKMDEMFKVARELSTGLSFIRVDLYCEEDKIYFGELTFFPQNGLDSNLINATDVLFGDKIKLKK